MWCELRGIWSAVFHFEKHGRVVGDFRILKMTMPACLRALKWSFRSVPLSRKCPIGARRTPPGALFCGLIKTFMACVMSEDGLRRSHLGVDVPNDLLRKASAIYLAWGFISARSPSRCVEASRFAEIPQNPFFRVRGTQKCP